MSDTETVTLTRREWDGDETKMIAIDEALFYAVTAQDRERARAKAAVEGRTSFQGGITLNITTAFEAALAAHGYEVVAVSS